jgi:hypothetical protein
MKIPLSTVGVVGLTAATVVSGLALTAAPVVAAEPAPRGDSSSALPSVVPLVSSWGGEYRYVLLSDRRHNDRFTAVAATRAEAVAKAQTAKVLPGEEAGTFALFASRPNADGEQCFKAGPAARYETRRATEETCASASVTQMVLRDGALSIASDPDRYVLAGPAAGGEFATGTSGRHATFFEPFSATVDSVDVVSRSAVVSGTADAGATVVVDGLRSVEADASGAWSTTVDGLELGANTVSLAHYVGDQLTGEHDLEVVVEISPLFVSTWLTDDRSQLASVSGSAHPGATIVVTDDDDVELARTTASADPDGTWQADLPAPGTGGARGVVVRQLVGGEPHGEVRDAVAYGAGVSIDAPADGRPHWGGPVTLTGKGEAGSRIQVRERGDDTVIGAVTVLPNGRWTLRTAPLDEGAHQLDVTQLGKGANTTRTTVSLVAPSS